MLSVINNVGHTHFHVLCDGLLLDGKTTAIYKEPLLCLVVYVCEMRLNGKNVCQGLFITLGTPKKMLP